MTSPLITILYTDTSVLKMYLKTVSIAENLQNCDLLTNNANILMQPRLLQCIKESILGCVNLRNKSIYCNHIVSL